MPAWIWVATTAPMIAMPSEPPTWRMLLMTAEPTPALATGTDPIAAAVVGVITSAIPKPPARRPGGMFPKLEAALGGEKLQSDEVTRAMTNPISQREPIRSDHLRGTVAVR